MTRVPAPPYEFRTVPVRGGELAVGVWGDADAAQTVLVVHGVTASHQSWPLVAQNLPGVRVIAPDLRGRGRSNALPGPYGMPQHADDLAAVLDAFDLDRVVVVGHSMGGFASLVLAHRHPERVSELVLVDGGLPLAVPPDVTPAEFTRMVLGPAQDRLSMTFESVDSYLDFWRHHPAFANDWSQTIKDYVAYDLDGDAPELRPSTSYRAVEEDSAEQLAGTNSVTSAVEALAHPAIFLRAPRGLLDADPLYTPEYVAKWSEKLTTLSTMEVDDVNHYTIVLGDAGAKLVAGAVTQVLARHTTKAGTTA
ncbi:MAG: alpha/beta hydrolase [Cryobacterium sp.]|nr:alpha/beta hydrolase [Cryobacterium sp.]